MIHKKVPSALQFLCTNIAEAKPVPELTGIAFFSVCF
jgi:hypothetical protein